MKQATHSNMTKADSEYQPLFTARDTCVGLAACMGVGLLTSLALSAIILVLSASAQAEDTASASASIIKVNKTIYTALYSPEEVISQNCDARNGQLRNITVGDKMVFRNEGNQQLHFRVTGIQAINEKPPIMPVVDESSMLTLITCYPANSVNVSASYLVMIEELAVVQAQHSGNTIPKI